MNEAMIFVKTASISIPRGSKITNHSISTPSEDLRISIGWPVNSVISPRLVDRDHSALAYFCSDFKTKSSYRGILLPRDKKTLRRGTSCSIFATMRHLSDKDCWQPCLLIQVDRGRFAWNSNEGPAFWWAYLCSESMNQKPEIG